MLNVVTLIWDQNEKSQWFSKCYDEQWVERLFNGFRRNLSSPFRPVLFTNRWRKVSRDIMQVLFTTDRPGYENCIEPYRLDEPMILCGLDTVVTGSCDQLAHYCMRANIMAVPRDPFNPNQACNGVALVPAGKREVYETWNGENDMVWVRKQPHKLIDLIFPGMVESYKGTVKGHGLRNESIVYFHGDEKPHQLTGVPWIRKHWLGNAV